MERRGGRGKTRTSRGKRGFTLVELMVVILLLGFVFLLTFPNFQEFLAPRDVKKAVRQFVGSVKYAQSQAATTKQRYRLNVDLKENAFWVSIEGEKNSFLREATPMGNPSYLPPGVIFLDMVRPDQGKIRDGIGYVEFSPTGWAEECSIHIRKGEEEVFTVFIRPLGGTVEVVGGYVERGKE